MNMHLVDLINDIVGMKYSDEFAIWAFGDNYFNMNGFDSFAGAWNQRHRDLFEISIENSMVPDVIQMTNLWKIHNNIDQTIYLLKDDPEIYEHVLDWKEDKAGDVIFPLLCKKCGADAVMQTNMLWICPTLYWLPSNMFSPA